MELKERYYRKLEDVLSTLAAEEDLKIADKSIKEIAGTDWTSIKEYIKTHKVASFASGTLWHVNHSRLEQALTEIRIKLDRFRQNKKTTRKNTFRQIWLAVISAFLGSIVTLAVQDLWSKLVRNNKSEDRTEQSTYEVEHPLDSLKTRNNFR
ncbi:MAG: hypothetical protein K2N48_01570 [Muribaculaceae bacterium]|nr:hypothetical protein [Muribaculaceae bacterium]